MKELLTKLNDFCEFRTAVELETLDVAEETKHVLANIDDLLDVDITESWAKAHLLAEIYYLSYIHKFSSDLRMDVQDTNLVVDGLMTDKVIDKICHEFRELKDYFNSDLDTVAKHGLFWDKFINLIVWTTALVKLHPEAVAEIDELETNIRLHVTTDHSLALSKAEELEYQGVFTSLHSPVLSYYPDVTTYVLMVTRSDHEDYKVGMSIPFD